MYDTSVCPLTISWPVYMEVVRIDEYLCVDGFRFFALLTVDSEEPAANRAELWAGIYQSQETVPHDSQHSVIPLLDETTRL